MARKKGCRFGARKKGKCPARKVSSKRRSYKRR